MKLELLMHTQIWHFVIFTINYIYTNSVYYKDILPSFQHVKIYTNIWKIATVTSSLKIKSSRTLINSSNIAYYVHISNNVMEVSSLNSDISLLISMVSQH